MLYLVTKHAMSSLKTCSWD